MRTLITGLALSIALGTGAATATQVKASAHDRACKKRWDQVDDASFRELMAHRISGDEWQQRVEQSHTDFYRCVGWPGM